MYHPIQRLNCPSLEKLNRLARHTVAFGLEQTPPLSDSDIKDAFVRYLAARDYPNAGVWLWGKYGKIRPHVIALVRRPSSEKQGILHALDTDLDLEACFQEGRFYAPAIPAASHAALNGEVKSILLAFYEDILNAKNGVPGDKIGEPINLTRQTVLQAYLTAQHNHLLVCPGCDGPPPSVADGKIHEDLDHVFPKAKYPFLTVHPLNLSPLCKHCNETFKVDKDALNDSEPLVSTITSLNEIYHSYLRSAREETTVQVQRAPNGEEVVVLQPRQPTTTNQARLNSLLYTLNIEARWTGDVQQKRVEADLETFLLHGTQDESLMAFDLPRLIALLRTIQISFQRACGKKSGYVAAEAYTTFVLSDAPSQAKWLAAMRQAKP